MSDVIYCTCVHCKCTATVLSTQDIRAEQEGQTVTNVSRKLNVGESSLEKSHSDEDNESMTELVILLICGILITVGKGIFSMNGNYQLFSILFQC